MQNTLIKTIGLCASACVITLVTGCQSSNNGTAKAASETPKPAVTTPAAKVDAAVPQKAGVIRIKAGSSAPFTDSSGNVWQAEQGFVGGDVVERDSSTAIANTKDSKLFLSEHYGMEAFSCNVPNGKYLAKLYFAETFEGISGAGERVFSFTVQGREFKNFDVWSKAGGSNRAYVESVPVEVKDGKFTITFTNNVENPMINAIEILPQP
jgi:hypothetical protein